MSTTPTTSLVDATGEPTQHQQGRSMNFKRVVVDYGGMIAIGMVFLSYGVQQNKIETHEREIERLRAANEARAIADVRIAAEMATKSDVREVRDQVSALATELRNARIGR